MEEFDEESAAVLKWCEGKKIANIAVTDNKIRIEFEGGAEVRIWDDAQYCCEDRCLTCEEDMKYYEGATFLGVRVNGTGYDEKSGADIQFLVIRTSVGEFDATTHNEHNGYYGGFNMKAQFMTYPRDA